MSPPQIHILLWKICYHLGGQQLVPRRAQVPLGGCVCPTWWGREGRQAWLKRPCWHPRTPRQLGAMGASRVVLGEVGAGQCGFSQQGSAAVLPDASCVGWGSPVAQAVLLGHWGGTPPPAESSQPQNLGQHSHMATGGKGLGDAGGSVLLNCFTINDTDYVTSVTSCFILNTFACR